MLTTAIMIMIAVATPVMIGSTRGAAAPLQFTPIQTNMHWLHFLVWSVEA
jgi:hypothetical protein